MLTRRTPDAVTAKLDAIAIANTSLETLDYRNSDRLDFHDMSVGEIRDLMRAAYELGQHDGAVARMAASKARRDRAAAKKAGR